MSAIKNVEKVTIPKVKTVKKLIYINEDFNEGSENAVDVIGDITKTGCHSYTSNQNDDIYFELGQSPYCCGFREVGDLQLTKGTKIEFITNILDALVVKNPYTMYINTNAKGSSIEYEKALAKCKYWQKVKTYKNPGSSSIITLWISKN